MDSELKNLRRRLLANDAGHHRVEDTVVNPAGLKSSTAPSSINQDILNLQPLANGLQDLTRSVRKRANSAADKTDQKRLMNQSSEHVVRQSITLSAKPQAGRLRPSKIPRRTMQIERQEMSKQNHMVSATSPHIEQVEIGMTEALVDTIDTSVDEHPSYIQQVEEVSLPKSPPSTSMQNSPSHHAKKPAVAKEEDDDPPIPVAPALTADTQVYPLGLTLIQHYINDFGYNHTSVPFYKMKKTGGTHHMLSVVEQIQKLSLPIQCVEAVFIATVLSSVWRNVDRIPLSFKSKFETSSHRHIVLAIHYRGKWGALGTSRRSCLMDKALEYDSLWDLIMDFSLSYESVFHRLLSVYVGLPMPHDLHLDQPLTWKAIKLRMEKTEEESNKIEIQKYLRRFLSPTSQTSTGNGRVK